MTTLVLHPLDTLFFRDGRPYNQDDPGQVEAASFFPPHPPTLVGAIRAALARAMGWSDGPWSSELKESLGDGVDWQQGDGQLGRLRFTGPYVLKGRKPLFPAPLCLVRGKNRRGEHIIGRLAPGEKIECDLPDPEKSVRLPAMPNRTDVEGWRVFEHTWLTLDGTERVLNGEAPERPQIFKADQIWQAERRIGVQRDTQTRTTKRFEAEEGEPAKGALYASAHARLAQDVTLAVEVEGLSDVALDGSLAPVGGEGRSVWIEQRDDEIQLPHAPDLAPDQDGMLRYTVVLVTPADLDDKWPGPGDRLAGSTGEALPGEIVSACVGRAIMVGGWDGAARRPLPLRALIPAGSVWFLEAKTEEAEAARSWHGRAIGRSTGWGFGRVLIGRWAPAGEET